MEQLSGQDASFVYLDTPTTPMHIGSVAIYDPSTAPGGFVRFKDILRHIESRLDRSRSFRQKLVRV
ncbi:wax ester/triacylglycerol synthase domain-containing protein, partial [Sphingorhabdus sp.]